MADIKKRLETAVEADQIPFSERCEASHLQFLTEFESKVWPVFQRFGYSKDTFLLYWILVHIHNAANDILNQLANDGEETV